MVCAAGDLREILLREIVLGVDPGLDLGRVDVFHPAVGIGDFGAEVVVDVVDFAGGGIGEIEVCFRGSRVHKGRLSWI